MQHGGCVYITTNQHHTVFHTGVTYIGKLVYFESYHSIEEAIFREKQVKKYRREKKLELVDSMNTDWRNLFEDVQGW